MSCFKRGTTLISELASSMTINLYFTEVFLLILLKSVSKYSYPLYTGIITSISLFCLKDIDWDIVFKKYFLVDVKNKVVLIRLLPLIFSIIA